MIKYLSSAIVFAEFPDEICLALTITNCPYQCKGCSQPELQQDIGTELTEEELDRLISLNPGITMIGFMGGDNDHAQIIQLAKYIRTKGLLVGMYSGFDTLDVGLMSVLNYYKIGRYIQFSGPEETWKNQTGGPITLPTSNQLMFKKIGESWANITYRFRIKKINDWKKEIID